jgi:CheY-like chemotaxis protein
MASPRSTEVAVGSAANTLLVVDDNEDNLELLTMQLEDKGYAVLRATSGEQALSILAGDSAVDLVVLDVMMPGVSGLDVLAELRKTRSSAQLPVIVATGRTDPNDVVRALDLGANDHVAKPIDINILLARIRAQLRDSRVEPVRQSTTPEAGLVFDTKYEIKEKIGTGGFGTVYRARHRALDTFVAVKVLHAHLIDSDTMRQRFAIEGISACRVRHANAVAVLDAGTTDQGAPYLVMELLEGKSLQQELADAGVLRVQRTAEIAIPVCEVLEAAHEAGVIHRDIKPGNIMLVSAARGDVVKVLDFGIAKLVDEVFDSVVTAGDQIVGTPHYMAPERLLARTCDGRSDVYSVGAMLYQMLSGRFAFGSANTPLSQALRVLQGGVSLEQIRPALPTSVVEIVMRCLAADPELRPALSEIAEVMRAASDHVEEVWPPQLIDVQLPDEVAADLPASGYAQTVALLRDAAENLARPSEPPGAKATKK